MKTNTNHSASRHGAFARVAAGLAAALLLLGLAGCSVIPEPTTDPTRYYLLAANGGTEAPATDSTASHGTLHLGLRSVDVPAFLRNTRTIVVRRGANEVRFEDYARWAEPLDAAVQRVVRERLLANPAVAEVESAPISGLAKRDYDVAIRVLQCEGAIDGSGKGSARFSAVYDILDPNKGGERIARHTFVAPAAAWDGSNFSQLAARLGDAAASLGADIAQNLPH